MSKLIFFLVVLNSVTSFALGVHDCEKQTMKIPLQYKEHTIAIPAHYSWQEHGAGLFSDPTSLSVSYVSTISGPLIRSVPVRVSYVHKLNETKDAVGNVYQTCGMDELSVVNANTGYPILTSLDLIYAMYGGYERSIKIEQRNDGKIVVKRYKKREVEAQVFNDEESVLKDHYEFSARSPMSCAAQVAFHDIGVQRKEIKVLSQSMIVNDDEGVRARTMHTSATFTSDPYEVEALDTHKTAKVYSQMGIDFINVFSKDGSTRTTYCSSNWVSMIRVDNGEKLL